MRGAILNPIKMAISMVLCLAFVCEAFGQVHDRYENVCPSLQDAIPPDLLQYLSGVTPDEKNAWCVTWAIRRVGKARYEPAVSALVRLLDFRRPQTPQEKMGFGDLSSARVFPAQDALEEIGKAALPEVLRAIEADSTSGTARENAVEVWMEAYKYERPKGVALLKQEEMKTTDTAIKQKLTWAIQRALTYCGPPEEDEGTACRKAAARSRPITTRQANLLYLEGVPLDKNEGVVKRHFFSAMLSSTAWISERWRTEALKLSR
jgi:hypothetical protein